MMNLNLDLGGKQTRGDLILNSVDFKFKFILSKLFRAAMMSSS